MPARSVDVMHSLLMDRYQQLEALSHEMLGASPQRDEPPHVHALSLLSSFVDLVRELAILDLDDPKRIDPETLILYIRLLEHVLSLGAKLQLPLASLLRSKTYRYDAVQTGDVSGLSTQSKNRDEQPGNGVSSSDVPLG